MVSENDSSRSKILIKPVLINNSGGLGQSPVNRFFWYLSIGGW